MSRSTSSKSTRAAPSPRAFHAAFIRTAAARAALDASGLTTINLDIRVALTTVLGALPRLATLRDAIAEALPAHDLAELDALGTYAEAVAYAHTAYLAASEPVEQLPTLVARASQLRGQLLSDATALAKRGFIDGKRLAERKAGSGYLKTGSDVAVLARILRERWSEIASKSAIEVAELDEAERLYERITHAYAERTPRTSAAAAASDDRQRAFTLLVQAYDQARRAVHYLRWDHRDADALVPSIWAGRGGRYAKRRASPKDVARAGAGGPDAAGNAEAGSDPTRAAHAPTSTSAPAAVGAGTPGSFPFGAN